jgi:hypothetical protein
MKVKEMRRKKRILVCGDYDFLRVRVFMKILGLFISDHEGK